MARTTGVLLALAALLLAACGGSSSAAFEPSGMAQGQPTFLYLFTEN
jgi:hypothetical protein